MIARSWRSRVAIASAAVMGCVLAYEHTARDSMSVTHEETPQRPPTPGDRLQVAATAYCRGTKTASGTAVRGGIAAADPRFLPVGSVVRIDAVEARYRGIYTVMDTGPKVRGRHVDIYMWNCDEAVRFGRRAVRLDILRRGWSPGASAPPGSFAAGL